MATSNEFPSDEDAVAMIAFAAIIVGRAILFASGRGKDADDADPAMVNAALASSAHDLGDAFMAESRKRQAARGHHE